MRHSIPAFPLGDVLDAEIGSQVDYPYPGVEQCRRLGHGDAVGSGEENEIAAAPVSYTHLDVYKRQTRNCPKMKRS